MLAQAARRIGLRRPSYERFIAQVEPALLSRPRVHRVRGGAGAGCAERRTRPRLTVCIDPVGGGDAALTRASLERQSVRPEVVAEQDLQAALEAPGPEWMVHLRAGDRLPELALERLGQAVTLAPDALIVTADDDLHRRSREARRSRGSVRARRRISGVPPIRPSRVQAVRRDGGARRSGRTPYRLLLELGGPDGAGHAHVPMVLCHAARPLVPRSSRRRRRRPARPPPSRPSRRSCASATAPTCSSAAFARCSSARRTSA